MLHHVITLCDVIIGCHSDNGGVKFEMINLNSRAIWFESEQLGELFVMCEVQVTKCHTVLKLMCHTRVNVKFKLSCNV